MIYLEKSGKTIWKWNRGGCRSQTDDKPASLEITGTQTFSADAEKLGAPIAVCGVDPDEMVSVCWPASLLEENRYRDIKGVISNFLRVTVTGDTDECGINWWWQTLAGCFTHHS